MKIKIIKSKQIKCEYNIKILIIKMTTQIIINIT